MSAILAVETGALGWIHELLDDLLGRGLGGNLLLLGIDRVERGGCGGAAGIGDRLIGRSATLESKLAKHFGKLCCGRGTYLSGVVGRIAGAVGAVGGHDVEVVVG